MMRRRQVTLLRTTHVSGTEERVTELTEHDMGAVIRAVREMHGVHYAGTQVKHLKFSKTITVLA